MRSPRFIRIVSVVGMSALVLGAFVAGPADAKKKKKKPAVCKTFTPGEKGADKPTIKVTDAATEEAPAVQTVTLDPSVADADLVGAGVLQPSSDTFNIQVDSAAKEAGLYAYLEFPTRRDYDLNLLHVDGSYAARSRGFQPLVETPVSAPGHGGEPTDHSEKLVGIRTNDCGGWTLDIENWLGEGGEFEVKMWLGDIVTDPQAPGEDTP